MSILDKIRVSKKALSIFFILLLLIALPIIIFESQKRQEIRQRAQEPCTVTQATCKWDSLTTATRYRVVITEVGSGTIIKSESVTATNLSFPAQFGKSYKCNVTAENSCGPGSTSSNTSFCAAGATPTPTPTLMPSVTPIKTPTPIPTKTPMPTPTSTPTLTPTPTIVVIAPTSTPTPTHVVVTATQTPIVSTPTPTQFIAQITPTPTLPPSGGIGATTAVGIGGIVFIILGGLLLALL